MDMPDVAGCDVAVGTAGVDLHVTQKGASCGEKRSATINVRLGGLLAAFLAVAAANAIRGVVMGVQSHGWTAQLWEKWVRALGQQCFICRRKNCGPAMSVIHPNQSIDVQRIRPPISLSDLTTAMWDVLRGAASLMLGPIEVLDGDARPFLDLMTRVRVLTQARLALVPHPLLIRHKCFSQIAQLFHFICMNVAESCQIEGATADIDFNALRLRYLAGVSAEIAITNGAKRGWLFAENRWYAIDPVLVPNPVSTVGCGDTWATSYWLGRTRMHLSVESALDYATRAAAACLCEVGTYPALPYGASSGAARVSSPSTVAA